MGQVRLLDCTLSASECYFSKKETAHILDGLLEAKSDVIELGLGVNRTFRINECLFYDLEDIEAFLDRYEEHLSENASYSILLDTKNPPSGDALDRKGLMIRGQVWKDGLEQGLMYCAGLIEQGHSVMLCPMETSRYSVEEFRGLAERAREIGAMGLYIVNDDSRMTLEEIQRYVEIADEVLPRDMVLGFHGKDGRGEVYECAKWLVGAGLNRTVQIDASVCGLSSRAGNLRSEIFSDFLNQRGGHYCASAFLKVYDKALRKLYRESVLLQYLSTKYQCSHRYAEYYFNEIGTPLYVCDRVLESIPEKKRDCFSKKEAYEYFRRYRKTQLDLAVIVPTCNRASSVDNLLFQSACQLRSFGIDIIIYDSSDDGRTEAVVRNFQIDGCENVFYRRYEGIFDGFSLDHKVISAYQEFWDQYEYLWVMRDGLIIDSSCISQLQEYAEAGFDCIVVDAKFRNGDKEEERVYSEKKDCCAFLEDQGIRMATLGTLIFSNRLIRKIIETELIREENYSLWQMIAPFYYFVMHPFKAVNYIGDVFNYNTVGTLNSFWNKAGKAMEQWAFRWHYVIRALPSEYDQAKPHVLKIEMYDFHPFYVSSLLRMRGNGGLSRKMIRQYRNDLPMVSDTALWKFYLVTLIPKSAAKYLSDHRDGQLFRGFRTVYLFLFGKKDE